VIHAHYVPEGKAAVPSPDVQFINSPNQSSRSLGVDLDSIVIHTTEVDYQGTLNFFLNPASQVSAHFVIAPDGQIVQMVDTARKAWHATYYNSRSIGIEMVGYAGNPSTWNENNLGALSDLLAWLVTAYDVSLTHPSGNAYDFSNDRYNRTGLVAHGQVQPWNRTDPGSFFPWESILVDVQQKISAAPEPSTAVIIFTVCGVLLGCRKR
jgi:N-acetylmuramoyl-L-alanine amidase